MKTTKIYFSDLYVSQDVFQQSRLVFPFFLVIRRREPLFNQWSTNRGGGLTNQHGTVYLSCVHEGAASDHSEFVAGAK